jgi:hypothetical protein
MPRAGANHAKYNARYEAKQKAAGWVRGPRITDLAAERLRTLAFQHRLTPSEVVCRLLLDFPLGNQPARSEQLRTIAKEFGVDDIEAAKLLDGLSCT